MLSLVLGYIGTVISIISMQIRKQKNIIFSQFLSNLLMALSYITLGGNSMMAGTGSLIGSVQCLINYFYIKKDKLPHRVLPIIFLGFSFLNCVINIYYAGKFNFPTDLIPLCCAILFVLGVNVKKSSITRVLFLFNASLWVIYDIMVVPIATANLVTHIFVVISVLIGILRYDIFKINR